MPLENFVGFGKLPERAFSMLLLQRSKEFIRSPAVRLLFFLRLFFPVPRHHGEPRIFQEKRGVIADEGPEKTVPYLAPFSLWLVRHFQNIIRA